MIRTMQNGHHQNKPYMLATGEKAVFASGPFGANFWSVDPSLAVRRRASSGMRVAEIGCGVGLTARWVSKKVSPGGSL